MSTQPQTISHLEGYHDAALIAQGGMGAIYRATDSRLNRPVALKLLLGEPQADAYAARKFLVEAQITGQLEHPNIVPIHELVTAPGETPFFSMKLVRGVSLAHILDALRACDPTTAARHTRASLLRDFLKVCDAVAYAHSRGVIHRDLKPANIMLGEFGEVLVMDWGLAKAQALELPASHEPILLESPTSDLLKTTDGAIVGTPAYMPPEQAEGALDRIDHRSDIYSLGAILYEILTLSPPYRDKNLAALLRNVMLGRLDPPTRRAPDGGIPRELEAAVLKAMARDRERRYCEVRDLQSDVQAHLEGRALSAARYTLLQRAVKWLGRHRAATRGAVLASILISTVALALWWSASSRRQRAYLSQISTLRLRADGHLQRVKTVQSAKLVEPNGEPISSAVNDWYMVHLQAQEALQQLTDLSRLPLDTEVRKVLDQQTVAAQRRSVALAAFRKAVELRDYALARVWLAHADAAGLPSSERQVAQAQIDAARMAQADIGARLAREYLEQARDLAAAPHSGKRGSDAREWLDSAVTDLARHKGPELVRLLLTRQGSRYAYVESRHELQRLLAIETLGRIGDTRTSGPDGRDAVQALCGLLEQVDLRSEVETAVALARALGALRDPRAHAVLLKRRLETSNTPFTLRSHVAFSRIPLPSSIQAAPRTALELHQRGVAFHEKGEHALALADLDRAIALGPKQFDLYRDRGMVHFDMGKPDLAISDYTRALELRPAHPIVLNNRGNAYLLAGRYKEALADFDRVLAMQPPMIEAYVNRGNVLMKVGRLDEAISDYTEALRHYPGAVGAWNARGAAHFDKGNLQAALADFTRAIDLNPQNDGAYNNRGIVKRRSKDPQGAIADFTQALRINPRLSEAYVNRSMARGDMGDHGGALADLNTAIAQHPDSTLLNARGSAHFRIGDYRTAIGDYTEAIRLSPSPGAYTNRGQAYYAKGDLPAALSDYDRALALDAKHSLAYLHRGLLRSHQRRYADAFRDLSRCLELDPGNPYAHFNRGRVCLAMGGLAEALADYERTVRKVPDLWRMPSAWAEYGAALRQAGRINAAHAAFRRAVEFDPEAPKEIKEEARRATGGK